MVGGSSSHHWRSVGKSIGHPFGLQKRAVWPYACIIILGPCPRGITRWWCWLAPCVAPLALPASCGSLVASIARYALSSSAQRSGGYATRERKWIRVGICRAESSNNRSKHTLLIVIRQRVWDKSRGSVSVVFDVPRNQQIGDKRQEIEEEEPINGN